MKIGLLSLSFPNFRYDYAEKYLKITLDKIKSDENELVCCEKTLNTENDINAEISRLRDENVDLLIVQCGTYSYGSSMMKIIEKFEHTPLLLWGFQEPHIDGFNGLPLNSLCGVNMYASFLHKVGKVFSYVYGSVNDDKVYEKVKRTIKAVEIKRKLKEMRFCIIGGRVPGFYLSNVDEVRFRHEIGPEIVYYSIAELLQDAEIIDKEVALSEVGNIKGEVDEVTSTNEMVEKTARIYIAIKNFKEKNGIDAFAIKCWPEFQGLYNCSVCGVVSRLNNENIMTSCEGDITGLTTMVIQQMITDSPCFFADLVNINDDGIVKTWHCGSAPVCLARECAVTKFTEHRTIKQGMGIAAEFQMKLGRVTMIKLKEDKKGYKFFMAKGEGIEEDREMVANQLDIRFDSPYEKVLDAIMENGIEHHYALAYDDVVDTLIEVCKWIGIGPIVV